MYNFKIEQLKSLPQRSNETWQGGLIRMPSWVADKGVKTLFIEPGSPWENGYNASFNGKLPDELLHPEIFDTLLEAKVLIERWDAITTRPGRTARWGTAPRTGGDCDMAGRLRGYAPPPGGPV